MPPKRKRRAPVPVGQGALALDLKKCQHCGDHIPRNLAQHEKICKILCANRRQAVACLLQQQRMSRAAAPRRCAEVPGSFPPTAAASLEMEVDRGLDVSPDPELPPPEPMDIDDEPPTVSLPSRFIFVKHHPHAQKLPDIIPLESSPSPARLSSIPSGSDAACDDRPYAPFRTFADYNFASRCVKRRMTNTDIDADLRDMHGGVYSSDCFVTFRNHRDLQKSLEAARTRNVPFCSKTLVVDFDGTNFGKRYEIQVEFRDPWKIMKRWACDPTLAHVSTWFSQEKYLCLNGIIDFSNPLYDEPCSGESWREVDDNLPGPDDTTYPSCYLGLHVWLDKGLVSTKVKMHPILFRGGWINSATRNGSGNGGCTLAGFVIMPVELRHIDPKTLTSAKRTEYDRLKRKIYHGVCRIVMETLRERSHRGEAIRFGDGITRVAHPGILIESMDFEELAAWLAIRNSKALHPCPQCLVHRDDLHRLSCHFPCRTVEGMSDVLVRAPQNPKTARDEFLKGYGLHDFKHYLWEFAHSDPYKATAYDCLHFFDGGIWGRHMWVLLKEYLQQNELASTFNDRMNHFPRWRNLNHLPSPTTIDYSDGQTFLDILKSALPCIVQLLPSNSGLVRLVRVMQKIRVMLGLDVTTRTRLEYLRKLINEYEKISEEISDKHGKSLDFLKQHFLSHAIRNFELKGTSRNMNTRPGEGFQQEVSAMYKKTNGRNAEHQIAILDESEETMARLDMQVEAWRRSQEEDSDKLDLIPSGNPKLATPWKLGSPNSRVSPRHLEWTEKNNPLFRNFSQRLREYLALYHPSQPVHPDEDIDIMPCKVLYIEYQSTVDWRSARDILRCNPNFNNSPRYDSIIYAAEDDPIAMGQLVLVFRCFLPHSVTLDLAMIRPYRNSSWHPKTHTDCPIREQNAGGVFIALEHLVRGVLLCPIFGASRKAFYVVDCIDEDMFLRINGID